MTEWGENLDPNNVHQEYPRPQLVREDWVNLNGFWNYAITPIDAEDSDCKDGQILVPFAVESALSGVGRTVTENDALWYEREFTVPKEWKGRRIMINFGAVDWHAQVTKAVVHADALGVIRRSVIDDQVVNLRAGCDEPLDRLGQRRLLVVGGYDGKYPHAVCPLYCDTMKYSAKV
jgi:hypothetical protein